MVPAYPHYYPHYYNYHPEVRYLPPVVSLQFIFRISAASQGWVWAFRFSRIITFLVTHTWPDLWTTGPLRQSVIIAGGWRWVGPGGVLSSFPIRSSQLLVKPPVLLNFYLNCTLYCVVLQFPFTAFFFATFKQNSNYLKIRECSFVSTYIFPGYRLHCTSSCIM